MFCTNLGVYINSTVSNRSRARAGTLCTGLARSAPAALVLAVCPVCCVSALVLSHLVVTPEVRCRLAARVRSKISIFASGCPVYVIAHAHIKNKGQKAAVAPIHSGQYIEAGSVAHALLAPASKRRCIKSKVALANTLLEFRVYITRRDGVTFS